jgi:hypothetical protein
VKSRKKDLWLVVQGVPIVNGCGSTPGEIVFEGAGSVEISRYVRACFGRYHTIAPTSEFRDYSVLAALGYKSMQGLVRYTYTLDLWEDSEDGSIYGNLSDGGPGIALDRVELAQTALDMDHPTWEGRAWERLVACFRSLDC